MLNIKFIPAETVKFRLINVENGQFFTDGGGFFCQKISIETYVKIAHPDGQPCGQIRVAVPAATIINSIHPKIAKIEF